MLQDGTKVHGVIDGHNITGYISHYMPWTTVDLDQALIINGDYRDHLYISIADSVKAMPANVTKVKDNKGNWIEQIPDVVGSECIPLPISDSAEMKQFTLVHYREQIESRLTTYKTVKRAVTCEYGCKHMIDTRIPVKPTLDVSRLNIAYFWHCLAEYARYLDDCEYTAKCQCWYHLAGKFALSCLAHDGSYGDLPAQTVKAIQAELSAQYESMCDDYKRKIFGAHLARYERTHRLR